MGGNDGKQTDDNNWGVDLELGIGAIDIIGRVIGGHLDKQIGTTSVFTTRQQAGGTAGYNWIYRAQPDGLTMGTGSDMSFALNKINELPGADYELDKFGYLMGIHKEMMSFFVAAKGPYQSIADLKAGKNLKIASSSAAGAFTMGGATVAHILELDAKVVPGYKGPPGVVLATEQGETVGVAMPIATSMSFYKAGRIKPLFIIGSKRISVWPDVPAITELVTVTGEGKELIAMWDTMSSTYTVLTPPGIPEDRMTFLRRAFDKIMADPEFRAEMDKIAGRKIEVYMNGEEMLKKVTELSKNLGQYKSLINMLFDTYRK